MQVINLVVGCHYLPPGPQLPSQPLRGLLPVLLRGEQRHDVRVWTVCLRLLPDSVAAAIWTQALLSAPVSSTLTTRLPSHPGCGIWYSCQGRPQDFFQGGHRRRKGSVVGGTMASAEHEPITRFWGQRSRGRAPGQGAKPPEAESILVIGCPTEPAI